MPILQRARPEELERLLDLFPLAQIKERWPNTEQKTKVGMCREIAQTASPREIENFVDTFLPCCKQHVYVCEPEAQGYPAFPANTEFGERVLNQPGRALYIMRAEQRVVLASPTEEVFINFLWPVRIDMTRRRTVVRFIILEKNIPSYFPDDRRAIAGNVGLSEEDVLRSFEVELRPQDLHQGVKEAWEHGYMDAFSVRYKTEDSVAWEKMNNDRGIRRNKRALYRVLQDAPLGLTIFKPEAAAMKIGAFSIDPTLGMVAFSRYSPVGESDGVIRRILQHN